MNGAEQAKQIYNRSLVFLLNDVKNLKCEDLIDSVVSKQQFHLAVSGMLTVQEALTCSTSATEKVDLRPKCFQNLSCRSCVFIVTFDHVRLTCNLMLLLLLFWLPLLLTIY